MKYEDVEKGILDLVQNPDTAPAKAQDLLKELKKDAESAEALAEKITEQDQKIRDLQDTNVQLLLNQTGHRPHGEEDDGDGHIHTREDVEKFFADLTAKAEKE